jgi:hypothetical protein
VTARSTRALTIGSWTLLLAIALLWPAKATGALDGAPLDGALEAILVGVCVPMLWVLHRGFLRTTAARALIMTLLGWKLVAGAVLTQQGLCIRASVRQPLDSVFLQMPIREPSGVLRSWDVRADWNGPAPQCTAIITRPLPEEASFPAWFVNITDQIIGRRDIDMTVGGVLTLRRPAVFSVVVDRGVQLSGAVGQQPFPGAAMPLAAGTHRVALTLRLTADQWRFEPQLDGRSIWSGALVTVAEPNWFDRVLGSWGWPIAAALVLALVSWWAAHALATLRPGAAALAASAAMIVAAVALALQPSLALRRGIGLMGFAALLVPVARRACNGKGVLLLVTAPWVAFFVARCFADIGRFSAFSPDDWLAYQLAGYRIYMHGYYLEGGTPAFDYQPLYRWINGALHLVFGDSSVGEHYWDAACLALGASLSYHIVRARAGFRWGMFAAAATLSTFSLGTSWYFIGRSLSEVAAAGWGFLAMLLLLRARRGSFTWVASGAAAAVLMFYTRLNHMLLIAFLPALLLPLRVPTIWRELIGGLRQVRLGAVVLYGAVSVSGLLALMWRNWLYTGNFSVLYGTSMKYNDTGLRSLDIFNPEVWSKVLHSLASFVFMNEPPSPDIRAVFVIAGVIVAIAALLQVPRFRRVPAAIVIAAFGASAGSFVAHGHPYPGRFSIHLVPLAVALSTIALSLATAARSFAPRGIRTRHTAQA